MAHGSALVIEPHEVPLLREQVREWSPRPEIDGLLFDFSIRSGMRVMEIAHLTPDAVLDPRGRLNDEIRITVTKGHRGRTIAMHPDTQVSLEKFFEKHPGAGWFAMSPRDSRQMTPAALGMHMKRIFDELGYIGCTSHSGRASCLTELAQRASEFGCSLYDVMAFAGHKHISSTQKYLRPSEHGRELVNALGRDDNHQQFQQQRSNNGKRGKKQKHRHEDPATVLQVRQHEAWLAYQLARSRVQSRRRP